MELSPRCEEAAKLSTIEDCCDSFEVESALSAFRSLAYSSQWCCSKSNNKLDILFVYGTSWLHSRQITPALVKTDPDPSLALGSQENQTSLLALEFGTTTTALSVGLALSIAQHTHSS